MNMRLTFGFLFFSLIDIEAAVDFDAQIADDLFPPEGSQLSFVEFIVAASRVTLATQEIASAARPLAIRWL